MSDHRVAILITGSSLNFLQQLSIQSFMDHGHEVDIFGYGPIDNLPRGTTLRHAAKVLPRAEFDAIGDSVLAESRFRYLLLAAHEGVISAEADICLRASLKIRDGYLFGWQTDNFLGGEILALPPHSPALVDVLSLTAEQYPVPPWAGKAEREALLEAIDDDQPVHVRDQPSGIWRSRALTYFLRASGEISHALPKAAFYPLPFSERANLLSRKRRISEIETETTLGIALYGKEIGAALAAVEQGLPKYWSPLGTLLRAHNVSPRLAPLPGSPEFDPEKWSDIVEENEQIAAEPQSGDASPIPEGLVTSDDDNLSELPAPVLTTSVIPSDIPEPDVMIVTTMKNEGPFILEWIAFHRSIGIRKFIVYTNDCDDGTDELLDLLVVKGFVTRRIDNPFRQRVNIKPQHAALFDSQTLPEVQETDWIIPMDVDEFIDIKVGDGTFRSLIAALPDANMISLTWRLFGNGFVRDYEDRFVTAQMTHCAHAEARKPHQAWGFKTAFRNNGIYRKFGVHRPKGLNVEREPEIRWYSSNGNLMEASYNKNGWRASKRNWGYGLVSLNHYAVRSSESYLVKKDRGRVNHVDRDQGLAYWFRMNHNAVEDLSIQSKLPAAQAEFDRMMADPEIKDQHLATVAAHRAKIVELKTRPDYLGLLEEIESTRMKTLSSMLRLFGNEIFLAGPSGVPPEIMESADRGEVIKP